MKERDEIVKAHDILAGILMKEVPNPFNHEGAERDLNIAASVLCWVLDHEHNIAFSENLSAIEVWMGEHGYTLRKVKDD